VHRKRQIICLNACPWAPAHSTEPGRRLCCCGSLWHVFQGWKQPPSDYGGVQPGHVTQQLKTTSFVCTHTFLPTESQNVRGWKGPLWVTQSNSLPKQGHLQQAAQDLVQAGLEYLQRRRLHSPSGQPVPGLHHPQREEVLPHVQLELPLLQFVPIAPCPVAGHH